MEPTIYVVDDDELTRKSLCALAESMGLKTAAYSSAEEFLDGHDENGPGCLITELRMLGMNGVQLQEKLAERNSALPVILLTGHASTEMTVRAIKNGAVTVLEKPCGEQRLWDAVCQALQHDCKNRERMERRRAFNERLHTLSPQEHEVMEMVIAGEPNKAIARTQGVSERTVETRRQNVFRKMGAGSLAELVRVVVESEADSSDCRRATYGSVGAA